MGRLLPSVVLLLVTAGSSCRSERHETIVLDDWWNVDFAKATCEHAGEWRKQNASDIAQLGCDAVGSCRELTNIYERCLGDPTQQVRDFEAELATELATEPRCAGIQFITFLGPKTPDKVASEAMAAPHWWLQVQFVPGAANQEWSMVRSDTHAYTKGSGQPKEIAGKLCSIASARGARLAN